MQNNRWPTMMLAIVVTFSIAAATQEDPCTSNDTGVELHTCRAFKSKAD